MSTVTLVVTTNILRLRRNQRRSFFLSTAQLLNRCSTLLMSMRMKCMGLTTTDLQTISWIDTPQSYELTSSVIGQMRQIDAEIWQRCLPNSE